MSNPKNNIAEILEKLDILSPFALQESWDNSGLILGSKSRNFQKIYLALEVTQSILEQMEENSLLITHHPLIFSPLKTLIDETYPTALLNLAICKNIQLIAMHTNFDITHLNESLSNALELEALGFHYSTTKDFSRLYSTVSQDITIESLALHIKKKLQIQYIRYSKGTDTTNTLYITCGSNASSYMIAKRGDCIITGDIKYHDAMIANSNGISFIDIRHFESECIFANLVAKILQLHNIQAIILHSHNPFCYI